MAVIGHTLVWHQQSPPWLFEDADGRPLPRKVALANIERYITTVVTHFRGRVHGWDVVNEAVNDPGRLGEGDLRDTPALRAIGPDYVEHAFRFARAADPGAELYYNDFHIERHAKREATLRLLAKLKAAGVAPDAVGIQAHWHLGTSMDEVRRGVAAYVEAGWPIMLTELDVSVLNNRNVGGDLSATREAGVLPKNPYPDGLPADVAARQAEIYALAFSLPREFPGMVRRITLWGFTDERTWLHDFPVRGRRDHPLVFDADLNPKPAYHAAAAALQGPAGE
jgi:endo-1,4-beta-xylanase